MGAAWSSRWVGSLAVLLALGALCMAPAPATAQGGRRTDSRMLDAIREKMQKGESLFLAGKLEESARTFEEGYREHRYPAFLFNAGIAYQKLGDRNKALERFRAYVAADPEAPDVDKVKDRIARLEAELAAVPAPAADAGAEPGAADAGADAGPHAAPPRAAPPPAADDPAMKSLAVIETAPPGAPVRLYAASSDASAPFRIGESNAGWKEIAAVRAPATLSLDVGRYHLVVEKFRDFNVSQLEFRVRPSYVHHLLANLSQGQFMAFLRVSANVEGAYVYLDDKQRARPPWGKTPHGELVSGGKHALLVDAPGFQPFFKVIELSHGEQKEIEVKLVRVGYGYLRVSSNAPEIKVAVDEKPAGVWRSGEAPLAIKLDSGEHRVVVRASGYKTLDSRVKMPRGQALPVEAHMIETYPRGAAWTQAVIGAVFLGAALYLGLESNSLHEELEADRRAGVLEAGDERISRGRWMSIGADVGFAIGGVLAILATYNFIKDPYPDSRLVVGRPTELDDPRQRRPLARKVELGRARVARPRPQPRGFEIGFGPLISPGGGGFGLGGRF